MCKRRALSRNWFLTTCLITFVLSLLVVESFTSGLVHKLNYCTLSQLVLSLPTYTFTYFYFIFWRGSIQLRVKRGDFSFGFLSMIRFSSGRRMHFTDSSLVFNVEKRLVIDDYLRFSDVSIFCEKSSIFIAMSPKNKTEARTTFFWKWIDTSWLHRSPDITTIDFFSGAIAKIMFTGMFWI